MNKSIKLEKIESSGVCTHIKITINNNEVGALYLKDEELDTLLKCLKNGIYSSEVNLSTNIFDDEEDFEFDEGDEND